MKDFFDALFNDDETTCMTNDLRDTMLRIPRGLNRLMGFRFFSINPMKDKRADSNVTSYRNILVEFDEGTISEQRELLKACGLPYTTLVFSGGKSLHAIISLIEPIQTEAEYRRVAKNIYKRLPTADQKVFNPSRFSRCPYAKRENGVEQELLEVNERVPLADLLAWIGPIETQERPPTLILNFKPTSLPARARGFIKYGEKYAEQKEWNTELFKAACDLFSCNYTKEEVEDLLSQATGHLDSKDRSTIESARKQIDKER